MTLDHKHTLFIKGSSLLFPFLFLSAFLAAQGPVVNEPDYSKPALFAELPDSVFITVTDIQSLFEKRPGEQVQLKMTSSFFYSGYVKTVTAMGNPQRVSLVIRSTNKQGSALYITKITGPNGQMIVRGRIISRQHIDAYDLVYSDVTGYQLRKKNYYKLINE
jgi:hypothetical protein